MAVLHFGKSLHTLAVRFHLERRGGLALRFDTRVRSVVALALIPFPLATGIPQAFDAFTFFSR